jgi:predicted NBD/HSP70 family sugar kinase
MFDERTSDQPHAVGVNVTAESLVGVVVDLDGEIVRSGETVRLHDTQVETVVAAIAQMTRRLAQWTPTAGHPVSGIGISIGGHVDGNVGVVHHSPQLRWRNGIRLASLLKEATRFEVVVDNDVKALACAEQYFGYGQGVPQFAVVKMALAGIGAALVSGEDVERGASGTAGELGHVPLELNGWPCRCGSRGCLETLAGLDVVVQAIRHTGHHVVEDIYAAAELAQSGSRVAQQAFERAGREFGRGLTVLLNLWNPSLIILRVDRAVLPEDSPYRLAATEFVEEHAFSSAGTDCTILWLERTDELEARGAASLAFKHL